MGMANSFINFTSLWIKVAFFVTMFALSECNCFHFASSAEVNVFPDSVIVTGLVESAAIPYLGIRIEELSLDEKAEILLLNQGYALI